MQRRLGTRRLCPRLALPSQIVEVWGVTPQRGPKLGRWGAEPLAFL